MSEGLTDERWDLDSAGPSRAEIAVATADIACRLRTNLLGINFAVEAKYENTAIDGHTSALETVRAHGKAEAERLPRLMRTYNRAP